MCLGRGGPKMLGVPYAITPKPLAEPVNAAKRAAVTHGYAFNTPGSAHADRRARS